jgi:hypothetical protein
MNAPLDGNQTFGRPSRRSMAQRVALSRQIREEGGGQEPQELTQAGEVAVVNEPVFRRPSSLAMQNNLYVTWVEAFLARIRNIPVLDAPQLIQNGNALRVNVSGNPGIILGFGLYPTITFHDQVFRIPETRSVAPDERVILIDNIRNFRGEPVRNSETVGFVRDGPGDPWKFLDVPPIDIWTLDAICAYILRFSPSIEDLD